MTDNNNDEENVMIDVKSLNLKNKVSISSKGVDLEQLQKAENIIASMADSYINWAQEDVTKLQMAYSKLVQDLDNYKIHLKDIFEIAHDMKGQGGSFNYGLMTSIGNYLCRFVERIKDKPTPKLIEIIKLHVDAMRMVISEKITGTGGAKGASIIKGLEATLAKYIPDTIKEQHAADNAE